MTRKTVFRSLGAAAAALLIAASVHATSMRSINLAETVEAAEKAFVGEVLTSTVVALPGGGFAEEVRVHVTRAIFGTTDGDVVMWLQARNSEEIRLPGMPRFNAGEEHLVFLYPKAPGSQMQAPVGLGQGAFRVHRNLETGEAFVRNEFMNRHLFQNLDVRAIAAASVQEEIATARTLTAEAQARLVAGAESRITRTHSGATEIESFIRTVQVLKAVPNPSEHFRGTGIAGGDTLLGKTVTIEPEILHGH